MSTKAIKKGRTSKYAVGTIHDTPHGKIKVLEYIPDNRPGKKHHRAVIRCLNTGFVTNVQCTNIPTGKFKDYRKRTVYGVGYIGSQITIPGRDSGSIIRRLYDLWCNMLKRVYGDYEDCYDGVTVDPQWHSFVKFMGTISEVPGHLEWEKEGKLVLDKDIRIPGSRVYSPATCMFVTPFENSSDSSKRRWASVNA